jgi:DNA helicase II / ATP-dependent DNA helicase PcrA
MQEQKKPIKLTPEQLRVTNCRGRVISLRGYHGTGKTKTLTAHIIKTLRRDKGSRLLAVSLTKRAAGNLSDMLHGHPNREASFDSRVVVGTIHSFAIRYLRRFVSQVGFVPDFEIDPDINDEFLRELIKGKSFNGIKKPIDVLKNFNRKYVRSIMDIESIADELIEDRRDRKLAIRILKKLKVRKREKNVMDFDDTLFYFRNLLENDRSVAKTVTRDFSHLAVDEFQDTTEVQWRIIRMLIEAGICFFAAGDPFQTLHRYAGASLERFDQLEAIPGCRAFELTENHRTTKPIVALANGLIGQISKKDSDKVWTNELGPKPVVYFNPFLGMHHKTILQQIRRHRNETVKIKDKTKKLTLNNMAVLARHDKDFEKLRNLLTKNKIPYVFYSKDTMEEPELFKVVKSILKIALHRHDSNSWKAVLSHLSGIGVKKKEVILEMLRSKHFQLNELQRTARSNNMQDLKKFTGLLSSVSHLKNNPVSAVQEILKFIGHLKKKVKGIVEYSPTFIQVASKSPDLDELLINLKEKSFGQRYLPKRHSNTEQFLTLGNIHQTKGLEFEVVFILGSHDGYFQRYETFQQKDKISEEISVMLTAITRSRYYLYMLFPMAHEEWKNKTHKENASIFIRNCKKKLYREYSVGLGRE